MRYALITPARNEATNIERTIRCVAAQTRLPTRWIIVNDGSTDETAEIIERYAASHSWIEHFDMPVRKDRSFGAKAHCFNAAWARLSGAAFEVIGNLDADISFDPDYLEFLVEKFRADPLLGVAGTPFLEDGYDSAKHSFEGATHVAGGCQLFRSSCLGDVGGYVVNRSGGVDWIAVTTARMLGWKTRSFDEHRFVHHRPLGTAERSTLAAHFSYGEKDYYLGNHPLWQILRIAFRASQRPYLIGGVALLLGYSWAAVRAIERPASPELIRFHRKEQIQKLRTIAHSLLKFRRFDPFSAGLDRTVTREGKSLDKTN